MSIKAAAKRLALAAAYGTGLHRVASGWFAGIGTVFAAHRVVEPGELVMDPSQAITSRFLARCLEHVRRRGYPILSIEEVRERLAEDRPGPYFVCFTFDDGYRDNLTLGLPIFERYEAPMCIYVATGFPDRRISDCWRALERLVMQEETIELCVDGGARRLPARTIAEKRAAYRRLADAVARRPDIAGELFSRYGIDPSGLLDNMLTWAELRMLAHHPLVTVGAHGTNHAALTDLEVRSARAEMADSKARLEAMLGAPVHHFAFPYGACGEREYSLARELGYRTATTSILRNVFRGDARALWSLPRLPLDSAVERLSAIDLHLSGMTGALTMRLRHPALAGAIFR
jgi:peptidoglycan/xylan/chitin deacetylase (PgdA/CDA1 family)